MSARLKLISITLLSFCYSALRATDHHCQHNKIQAHHHDVVPVSFTNYAHHPYDSDAKPHHRRLAQASGHPIRIVTDTSQLEQDLQSDPQLLQHARQLIRSAIVKLQSMIHLLAPVQDNLRLHRQCQTLLRDKKNHSNTICVKYRAPKCFLMDIPSPHLAEDEAFNPETRNWTIHPAGAGVPNADLILYATSQKDSIACNTANASSLTEVIAWAGTCVRDQHGKPVAGAINICPSVLRKLTEETLSTYEIVVLHELIHVLVFSRDNMANFVDKNGNKIPLEQTIGTDTHNIQYVISPTVRQVTREHFGCEEIHGAMLEPHGGVGTNGNHWMINFHGEMMTPFIFNHAMYFTKIDLALFIDSGWYVVDMNTFAEPWRFGYHAGCEFFFSKCTDATTLLPSYPQYFCNQNYENGCSWDGLSLSSCQFVMPGAIETDTKYLDSNLNLEICSYEEAQSDYGSGSHMCVDRHNMNHRCIRTEFAKHEPITSENQILFGRCYAVHCRNYNHTSQQWGTIGIEIEAKNNSVTCDRSDELQMKDVSVHGKSAKITCPVIDIYCNIFSPFKCVHGWYNEIVGQCVCSVGWTGDICADRLNGANSS